MSLLEYYDKETNTMILPSNYNKEIDSLPSSMTNLVFGEKYNKKINNILSNLNALTHLTFGVCFDQKINELPESLTHLTFGHSFNQKVDNLPKMLIELGFSSNCKIKNNIPENIKKIKIIFNDLDEYYSAVDNLPPNIKEITIKKNKFRYLKKVPFGCKILDETGAEIII